MASQGPGEPPDPPLICPNKKCEEEIDKEDDGSYPLYCSFCGEKLLELETKCPYCKAERKKSKKSGVYGKFCHKCPYDYTTREMRGKKITLRVKYYLVQVCWLEKSKYYELLFSMSAQNL